ncbi:MAG: glycosyltransferase [Acidobacteriota bacterium]
MCGVFSHRFPDEGPRVAIIIPTRNNLAFLTVCLDSLHKTTYQNYEVVIVDNESDDPATLDYMSSLPHKVLRIPNPNGSFSFAAINNRAVEQVNADYILFLNDDTEVISPDWLSGMVGYLKIPGVGAVGARLLLPDGRVQHAGVVHGYYNRMAGPAFKLMPATDHGYLNYAKVARNYSAVTAACMLTPKALFANLRGFDEQDFAVAYNDVDYCYRLLAAGYRIVYCPGAELIHHEGASRGFRDNPRESASFLQKYDARIDPYYNPNLSLRDESFAIKARTADPRNLGPIRTLMCAFNLNLEGAPHSQYEMTVGLMKRGVIEPIVYSPSDGPLRQEYERQGIEVRVREHPLAGVSGVTDYETRIDGFTKWIKNGRIDLVYGNTLQTFYAIEAAHHLNLPSVWNPRESDPWQTYFDFLPPEIANRALQCFSYPYEVVFVSHATLKTFQPLNSRHNFMMIHNGLNRDRFNAALRKWPREAARKQLGVSESELLVLLPGTVCERKGQLDLAEAIRQLSDQNVARTKFLIVGDRSNDYSDRLKKNMQRLPYSRRARLEVIPETADLALYYAAADIFVCTSRVESFPRVILEALAAGLPIITTPVFGIAEQVQENMSALFYEPGDAQALAKAITMLIEDPEIRHRLTSNSKPAIDVLTDFDSMVDSYAEVFREAWLSGASRSRELNKLSASGGAT